MIDVLIALKRTSGQDLAAYTAYRQIWESKRRGEVKSLMGGRRGGSGGMELSSNLSTQPGPTNVLWDDVL